MFDGLSYPSFRCVLEHMEANTRIHLVSRCPVLHNIEKAIPLHLDYLYIKCNEIRVNNITYKLLFRYDEINETNERYERDKPEEYRLTPGDVQFGKAQNQPWMSEYLEIRFGAGSDTALHRRLDMKPHVAEKKLACDLLGRRKKIRAKTFELYIYGDPILRLPVGFKVKTSALRVSGNFESILGLVDPSSFPLQELKTTVSRTELLEHPVVKSAKVLKVTYGMSDEYSSVEFFEGLRNVKNKSVYQIECQMNGEEIMELFGAWTNIQRDIGTMFMSSFFSSFWMNERLDEAKRRFNGKCVKLNVPDEKMIPESKCISFPISPNSELVAYGICGADEDPYYLKLEMMPRGSTTSLELSMSMSGVLSSLGAALNLYNRII
ncbi:hypothetical protein GCK72_007248 [Caenorhabditis remanei]|uniref:DUF38 domain-containing protein n=1 Tax=Caenorhabditis remanei TaxID=31234 RepID=A0A6A5HIQ1_CAERE|nr:hypothetical protein GCK72_007248 [Caenorhabditis remanei]KAF1767289.1 hypothetical protein GCK72_007248 [Caenorhabditis remanei]